MRITLIISSLLGGGAERTVANMANYWVAQNWQVTVLVLVGARTPVRYRLHPDVLYQPLGLLAPEERGPSLFSRLQKSAWEILHWSFWKHLSVSLWQFLRLNRIQGFWIIRQGIRNSRPQAVISFIDQMNIVALFVSIGLKIPIIVSERTDPFMVPLGNIWKKLRKLLYPWAAAVVVQTERAREYFSERIQKRITVIPNAVPGPPEKIDKRNNSEPMLVAMGRLSPEKGYDILFQAFALVHKKHPAWKLTVIGEGPLRDELEMLRNDLGLQNAIQMPGWSDTPQEYLAQAKLFVMASRFEGFPNALCEAMACGLPVVSTETAGTRAIVRPEIDGLLIPAEDVKALVAALDRMLTDPKLRKNMGDRAVEVTERFSEKKIMKCWEQVLTQVCKE